MEATNLIEWLDAALAREPPSALAVALSGGLDSTALLHALAALPRARDAGLRALHVDHGLHPEAPRWAEHCAALCASLQVPLTTLRVSVERDAGLGLEAAAREARYAALAAQLGQDETLATAHHRDDQAETLLLRLLRGGGRHGLSAMRGSRPLGAGRLWRPLLELPRTALLAHAAQHRLEWIEDPANTDPNLDRNFLRHRVLPVIRSRWPHADAALAASARRFGAEAELLATQVQRSLADCRGIDPFTLRLDTLRALRPVLRDAVLLRWIGEQGAALPPAPVLGRVGPDLFDAAVDADPRLAWRDVVLRRYRDLIYLYRGPEAPKLEPWTLAWDGRTPLRLPTGDRLQLEPPATDDCGFRVRSRTGGERIRLPGRAHRHRLKHVLQELGALPWERARLPLLFAADGELLAAGDRVIAARFDLWLREHAARLCWLRD